MRKGGWPPTNAAIENSQARCLRTTINSIRCLQAKTSNEATQVNWVSRAASKIAHGIDPLFEQVSPISEGFDRRFQGSHRHPVFDYLKTRPIRDIATNQWQRQTPRRARQCHRVESHHHGSSLSMRDLEMIPSSCRWHRAIGRSSLAVNVVVTMPC